MKRLLQKLRKGLRHSLAAIGNRLSEATVIYVVEDAGWVIRKEGENIAHFLAKAGVQVRLTVTPWGARNKIVHYGSINTLLAAKKLRPPHPSNKIILTWYHSADDDPRVERAKEVCNQVSFIHTSCQSTKDLLVHKGAEPAKIFLAPIPVDLSVFAPIGQREKVRKEFGVPAEKFVIGSFQKDGQGWGEGNEPKLIKGPDILCDAIEHLVGKLPLHVLLSGPSRGYVKGRLDKMNVPYSHVFLKNPDDVVHLYEGLDCYLVSSRVEGGPKALMESWAMGVPLVSTRMGMIADHARHEVNALLTEVGDARALADGVLRIAQDRALRERLTAQGKKDVLALTYEGAVAIYKNKYEELQGGRGWKRD